MFGFSIKVVESTSVAAVALPPTDLDKEALAAIGGIMPAIANYCKKGHKHEVYGEGLNKILDNVEKRLKVTPQFLSGDSPGYADCYVATKV